MNDEEIAELRSNLEMSGLKVITILSIDDIKKLMENEENE